MEKMAATRSAHTCGDKSGSCPAAVVHRERFAAGDLTHQVAPSLFHADIGDTDTDFDLFTLCSTRVRDESDVIACLIWSMLKVVLQPGLVRPERTRELSIEILSGFAVGPSSLSYRSNHPLTTLDRIVSHHDKFSIIFETKDNLTMVAGRKGKPVVCGF